MPIICVQLGASECRIYREGRSCFFVYGTLRPSLNLPASDYLRAHGQSVGPGTMTGELYQLDGYPGFIPASVMAESTMLTSSVALLPNTVHGELVLLDHADVLLALDQYEECNDCQPELGLYRRWILPVQSATGEQLAWVYCYQGLLAERALIVSGNFALYRISGA